MRFIRTNHFYGIPPLNHSLSVFALVPILQLLSCLSGFADIDHAQKLAQQAAYPSLEGPEPFILRQSFLRGNLEPGAEKVVTQQLFNKNVYQFWFAVADPGTEVLLNIYDKDGKLLKAKTVTYGSQKNVTSLVFAPEKSGTYYLRLAFGKNSDTPQDWALIYAYR